MADVLIAGAGPTGLAAALFLARRGVAVRIFDKAPEPATTSKALAVNPRTLELLAGTGVDEAIRAEGRPVGGMTLFEGGRQVFTLDVAGLGLPQPMMVIPQARTEALLAQELAAMGVMPERGIELAFEEQDARAVHVRLTCGDGAEERTSAALLLGADGAHSPVRHALGVGFPGHALPEPWELADVRYASPVDAPEGYVELREGGFVFAMAFDEARTLWRYISTCGDPTAAGPPGAPAVAEVPWRSTFKISHRIADRLAVGRVALAGDAAHLHSPMGARGMNLGIEDAYVFAACATRALAAGSADRIADYGLLRRAVDRAVVRRVELLTHVVRGRGAVGLLRRLAPLAGLLPAPPRGVVNAIVGLDHPVRVS